MVTIESRRVGWAGKREEYLWLRATRPETLPIKRQHLPLQTGIGHRDVGSKRVSLGRFVHTAAKAVRGSKCVEWRQRVSFGSGEILENFRDLGQGGRTPPVPQTTA